MHFTNLTTAQGHTPVIHDTADAQLPEGKEATSYQPSEPPRMFVLPRGRTLVKLSNVLITKSPRAHGRSSSGQHSKTAGIRSCTMSYTARCIPAELPFIEIDASP